MLIENARLSFPSLFVATSYAADQGRKYSATFILPKSDSRQLGAIKAAMQRAADQKWGRDKPLGIQSCLRDGDADKTHLDGFQGCLFFNASNDKRPGVYDRDRSPLTQDDGRPYAGCRVNAEVEFWAQDNHYGRRINASLRGVQFVADDDAFGGTGTPATADEFPQIDTAANHGAGSEQIVGGDADFLS